VLPRFELENKHLPQSTGFKTVFVRKH